jgi:DNA modification methylase
VNWRVIQGDTRDGLRSMPERSVHTCVTSPPYWGLRDYGTSQWDGGDAACDHKDARQTRGNIPGTKQATQNNGEGGASFRNKCGKCGARRIDQQIGLEQTPDAYVAAMVEVFREVRRVLRDDGTVWCNLGDSYAQSGMGGNPAESEFRKQATNAGSLIHGRKPPPGLKPKDIIGIPWRVAFALQADGWYLRQDIIWAKPNPMPESVTDRCTKSHEYLFLLAKNARYYYDAAAIAEDSIRAGDVPMGGRAERNEADPRVSFYRPENGSRPVAETRNRRSVWTIATQPFPEAHFATFPEALVEPCIKAGSPVGGLVLDPFSGSGTTGVVALKQGRSYVGMELNPEYVQMSMRRLADVAPLLAKEVA